LDACGNPISESAAVPQLQQPQPTPAQPQNSAETKPSLGPETAPPKPLDSNSPKVDVPPMKAVPAPRSQVYPSKGPY
jgi:hypothetical protein